MGSDNIFNYKDPENLPNNPGRIIYYKNYNNTLINQILNLWELQLLILTLFFIILSSCSKDNEPQLMDVVSERYDNLYAPQSGGVDPRTGQFTPISGEFIKFSFPLVKLLLVILIGI